MAKENAGLAFRLNKTYETRNYLLEEIKHNELIRIRKNHKEGCTTLNYVEHLLILTLIVTGCVSISAFETIKEIKNPETFVEHTI